MPIKRSTKKLTDEQIREYRALAERIDREEGEAIREQGRAVFRRHEHLREAIRVLRAERERLGLSLTEVGERSGIGKTNLSRLENDPNPNPTLDTIMRYAAALGRDLRIVLDEPPRGRRRAS